MARAAVIRQARELLSLLAPYAGRPAPAGTRGKPGTRALEEMLDACRAARDDNAKTARTIRSIHHFACTGGTLISRALAAQANVFLASELDPFSDLGHSLGQFRPTDILAHRDTGLRRYDDKVAGDVFLAGLETLQQELLRQGQSLIIRDHPHSHFCMAAEVKKRPLMADLLRRKFVLRNIVTVRHPLDSFLSISNKGWTHFLPATLEEYACRYQLFLDAYAASALYRYEDFVRDPDSTLQQIAADLNIAITPYWQELLPGIQISGASGRSGDVIAPRPRRPIPPAIEAQAAHSPTYETLCARLGYDPDFARDPFDMTDPGG